MENKPTRKRASREEMIERLENQNAKYEMMITRNKEKIKKLQQSVKPTELIAKINEAGLTIEEVIRMIEEKNKT